LNPTQHLHFDSTVLDIQARESNKGRLVNRRGEVVDVERQRLVVPLDPQNFLPVQFDDGSLDIDDLESSTLPFYRLRKGGIAKQDQG
jgi:hypothetical protein